MSDWYVFRHDGPPLGPWPTEVIAASILKGHLAPDIWVAAPGGQTWVRARDVPVIARQLEGAPTTSVPESGLHVIARAPHSEPLTPPVFDSTDEMPPGFAAEVERAIAAREPAPDDVTPKVPRADAPPTTPGPPPAPSPSPSPTPPRGGPPVPPPPSSPSPTPPRPSGGRERTLESPAWPRRKAK